MASCLVLAESVNFEGCGKVVRTDSLGDKAICSPTNTSKRCLMMNLALVPNALLQLRH
jgi:hypothetical protein